MLDITKAKIKWCWEPRMNIYQCIEFVVDCICLFSVFYIRIGIFYCMYNFRTFVYKRKSVRKSYEDYE